jgi:hypothetical protein
VDDGSVCEDCASLACIQVTEEPLDAPNIPVLIPTMEAFMRFSTGVPLLFCLASAALLSTACGGHTRITLKRVRKCGER